MSAISLLTHSFLHWKALVWLVSLTVNTSNRIQTGHNQWYVIQTLSHGGPHPVYTHMNCLFLPFQRHFLSILDHDRTIIFVFYISEFKNNTYLYQNSISVHVCVNCIFVWIQIPVTLSEFESFNIWIFQKEEFQCLSFFWSLRFQLAGNFLDIIDTYTHYLFFTPIPGRGESKLNILLPVLLYF